MQLGSLKLTAAAGLLALAIAFAPGKPAHASPISDLKQCLEVVKDAAEAAPTIAALVADPLFGYCTGQATGGDVVMIGSIVALSALAAAGEFNSAASCNALIDTKVASLVADALLSNDVAKSILASILGKDPTGPLKDLKDAAEKAAADGAGGAVQEMLQETLGPLLMYMTCGCEVAGTAASIVKVLKDVGGAAAQCGEALKNPGALIGAVLDDPEGALKEVVGVACDVAGVAAECNYISDKVKEAEDFVASVCQYSLGGCASVSFLWESGKDAGGEVIDVAEAAYNWVKCKLVDCPAPPPDPAPPPPPSCASGWVQGKHAKAVSSLGNFLGESYYGLADNCTCPAPTYPISQGDKWGTTLIACICPNKQGYSKGTCSPCLSGWVPGEDGVCTPLFCPVGQKPNQDQTACVRACDDPKLIFDPASKSCTACTEGVPTLPLSTSSIGYCAKGVSIEPCNPAGGGVLDPVTNQCIDCAKENKVATYFDGFGGKKSSAGSCKACDAGTKISFPANLPPQCVPACPAGSITDPVTGKCNDCGKYSVAIYDDGAVGKKSSAGYCSACNVPFEKKEGNYCVPSIACESWQTVGLKSPGKFGGGVACINKCPAGQQFTAAVPGTAGSSGGGFTDKYGTYIPSSFSPGSLGSPQTCKACDAQKVLNSSNQCVSCTDSQTWTAGRDGNPAYCAPKRGTTVSIPPLKPPAKPGGGTTLNCRPGRVPNAAGTACVIDLNIESGPSLETIPGGSPRLGITKPPPLNTPPPVTREIR